jgi:hypothetical protein
VCGDCIAMSVMCEMFILLVLHIKPFSECDFIGKLSAVHMLGHRDFVLIALFGVVTVCGLLVLRSVHCDRSYVSELKGVMWHGVL